MKPWLLAYVLSAACFLAGCDAPATSGQQTADRPPAGTMRRGPAFQFTEITEGIYLASGTGTLSVGSNSVVIVNEDDVMLVDSHITPAAAWVLLEELKSVTDKPVRYVVNTHHHFDHAHGNQIYGRDVEVIGHEFVREMLSDPDAIFESRTYRGFTQNVPTQIENLRQRVAEADDPEERERLENQLQVQENYQAALAEVVPTPPTVTLQTKMTLFRGGREIQLLFLGRGHTGGDVVVYLPEERIICTGDLFLPGVPYMGDAYVDEWADTLEELKRLDFETVLPGHGAAFTDRQRIDHLQAYLRDFWNKASELRRQGVPAEEAAQRIDMTNHRENYPNIQRPGVDVRAVLAAYERWEFRGQ